MTLTTFDQNRLVEYTSAQSGLPDARHERHFDGSGESFDYRLVVEYEPRSGLRGLYDRVLVRRGIERALRQTVRNLEGVLEPSGAVDRGTCAGCSVRSRRTFSNEPDSPLCRTRASSSLRKENT